LKRSRWAANRISRVARAAAAAKAAKVVVPVAVRVVAKEVSNH